MHVLFIQCRLDCALLFCMFTCLELSYSGVSVFLPCPTGPLGTGSGVLLGCLLLAGSLPGWVHLNERSSWVHLNESNQPHTQRHRDVKDEQMVGLVDE